MTSLPPNLNPFYIRYASRLRQILNIDELYSLCWFYSRNHCIVVDPIIKLLAKFSEYSVSARTASQVDSKGRLMGTLIIQLRDPNIHK